MGIRDAKAHKTSEAQRLTLVRCSTYGICWFMSLAVLDPLLGNRMVSSGSRVLAVLDALLGYRLRVALALQDGGDIINTPCLFRQVREVLFLRTFDTLS